MVHDASDRVVVTGIGVVTPIGVGKQPFWRNLLAGQSGVGPIQSFDSSAFDVHIGAEVKAFDPGPYLRRLPVDSVGRCSQLAIAAAKLALTDAGLPDELDEEDDDELVGIVMGTTMGESRVLEAVDEQWVASNGTAVGPDLVTRYPCQAISSNLAMELGARGPTFMIPTACAAGNYAIGYAFDLLKRGRATMMLAGGADCFSRVALAGFARLAATAPAVCQPFDRHRKGMVVGEGSAVLVLETLAHAMDRNAPVYAEVLGYGLGCDAFHMTGSHPEGAGTVAAMANAFREARLGPDEVDYISAHGTGTPTNDRIETRAIKQAFGSEASRVPVSSIKSMIGHTMGAASAIEAAVCALAITHGAIPPTINYAEPDPECDLDCVPNEARDLPVDVALNNSSAFGGNNAVLLLGRV
jgi:3-oxoacyl-[acyl-carrier-protein] synthase II